MNCLIVDDNIIARTTLEQLASHIKDLTVVQCCENAFEAYALLKTEKIDLILLDIEMKEMSGIELTKSLGTQAPVIIFITSKKDYALDAFDLNVADYLVKPVTPARFLQAIEKAGELLNSRNECIDISNNEFIFIRDSNIVKRIQMDNILYVEAMGDYVKIYTTQKFYAIHKGLKDVELRLPSDKFIRIHRSFIVAVNKIDSIEQGVIEINGTPIPVADPYRNALNKRLNIL